MAIFHLTVKSFSRKKKTTAKSKRDYITREKGYAKDDAEIEHKHSNNLPDWARDDEHFWSSADQNERANAILGREIEAALPKELSPEGRVLLAATFAEEVTGGKHPYTLAVHKGLKSRNPNPHMHMMFTARTLDGVDRKEQDFFKRADRKKPERGGAYKEPMFEKGSWVRAVRTTWAQLSNTFLMREGHQERITALSHEDRGLDELPQRHMGPRAMALEAKGIETDRGSELIAEAKIIEAREAQIAKGVKALDEQIKRGRDARNKVKERGVKSVER